MSILGLPREIYLMVCSYLAPTDLTKLAGVSRDHYVAAQHPLYDSIRLTSYGALVQLVRTLMKVPIVSNISAKQRLHWHKLSEAQLRERDIKNLDLLLDNRRPGPRVITGADLARVFAAISRKCVDIKITLTLNGVWPNFAKQLDNFAFPNVQKLTLYLGEQQNGSDAGLLKKKIWELIFAGATFPDLRDVYLNTLVGSAESMPRTLDEGVDLVASHPSYEHDPTRPIAEAPFYGLLKMREIKIEHNTFLHARVLESLFGSTIIPKHLTTLEIVNCPGLDQVKDLSALSILLQRGLQLVQWLKVHIFPALTDGNGHYEMRYASKINEKPEHHLCNIVRELGQKIRGVELAVPFACNRMFVPAPRRTRPEDEHLELPTITVAPVDTLPQRIMDAGYRYRRLICWRGICRGAHGWDDMRSLASQQGDMTSWEILFDPEDRATWCMSGCLPVEFSAKEALERGI